MAGFRRTCRDLDGVLSALVAADDLRRKEKRLPVVRPALLRPMLLLRDADNGDPKRDMNAYYVST